MLFPASVMAPAVRWWHTYYPTVFSLNNSHSSHTRSPTNRPSLTEVDVGSLVPVHSLSELFVLLRDIQCQLIRHNCLGV